MFVDLAARRILVTGASSGIGRQVSVDLANRGAQVVFTGRDVDRLAATASMLSSSGHVSVAADLTNSADIAQLADQCGQLDGVVHCAGRTGLRPLKLLNADFLQDVMQANFVAPIMLMQRLLQRNRMKPKSSIIFVTSIAGHTGTVGVGPYSASKAALAGFMRAAALEVASRKIRMNCVAPAIVRTEIFTPEDAAWLVEQEKRYPLGLGKSTDVSNCIQFLLSDSSSYITGTSVIMDGGCQWI